MFREDKRIDHVLPLHPFGAESLSAPSYYQKLREAEMKVSKTRGVYLFPVSVKEVGGNKWGYINARGEIVIPPQYEHGGDFQDNGIAIVRINGLCGLIDSTGYFILKPTYETINPFSEGRATVIDQQGFRVIDESGKEITSRSYSFIGDYKEGRAIVADSNEQDQYLYGYLNRWGKVVLPLAYQSASDFQDGKAVVKIKENEYQLIGLTGKVIHSFPYAFVGNAGEELLAFQKSVGGKFGYVDEKGIVQIEPRFSQAEAFIEGRAIVNISEDFKGQYGLIDVTGQFIIKPNYQTVLSLDEGRIALGKATVHDKPYMGSLFAVADLEGHILTGFIYNGITKYIEGKASVYNDKSTFFIDRSGKRIENLPIVQGSGELHLDKSLIKSEVDFRLQYFDKNGVLIWKQNQRIPLNEQYSVVEHKYKPNKDYLVYYPSISGMENEKVESTVNQHLRDLSGVKPISPHKQLDSSYTGDFEVTFYQKDLLVIEKTGYDYPFGAAHGMPIKKYVHIDLVSGVFYGLKDLFRPGSQYVKMISAIIAEEIKNNEKYSYVFPDRFVGIRPDQPFFISGDSIHIYFNPYEIAPYSAGFPTFTIPFSKLDPIIYDEGDFWKAFH